MAARGGWAEERSDLCESNRAVGVLSAAAAPVSLSALAMAQGLGSVLELD